MKRRLLLAQTCLWSAFPFKNGFARMLPEKAEVIIAGGGAAGLTAACAAAEAGAENIVLFERTPVLGGSSVIARGSWAVSQTSYQAMRGIKDSDDLFMREMLEVGQGKNNRELLKNLLPLNRVQFEWFVSQGVDPKGLFAERKIPRVHSFDAEELIFTLREKALEYGVKIFTGARVLDLLASNGEVKGVRVRYAGQDFEVKAEETILCTGGFARNRKLLQTFHPELRFATSIAAEGTQGDGLVMARKLGAAFADIEDLNGSYAFVKDATSIDDKTVIQYLGALIVNKEGRRFVNESLQYRQVAREVLQQPLGQSFLVFDESLRKRILSSEKDKPFWNALAKGSAGWGIVSGRTIGEAAEKAFLDPVELKATVEKYNSDISNRGKDSEFGRTPSGGGETLPLITRAPFYILPAFVCLVGTYCGLKIDEKARVLNIKGEYIPGLRAAGETAGGVHGAAAVMGGALAAAFGGGRLAGMEAAGELL